MHRRDFVLTAGLAATVAATIRASLAQEADGPATRDGVLATQRMRRSARAFLASLSDEQRRTVIFPLNAGERTQWSNLPVANVPRVGLSMGDLDDRGRREVHALLRASASSQGYLKMAAIMQHDDLLRASELAYLAHNPPKPKAGRQSVESMGSGNYWIAFFGDPTADEPWGWLFTGHHLGATFTVAGGSVAFLPLFVGADPNQIEDGPYVGTQVLSHEARRGFELLHALNDTQRATAVVSPDTIDMAGVGRENSLTRFEGLPASALDTDQQRLLWALVEEYVRNTDFAAADAQIEAIKSAGIDKLFFSWRGPVDDPTAPFYYRVHGPRILIEYAVQEPNHIHTITRDPSNDYGTDWLGIHYQEHAYGGGKRPT
ncbi:MAG TPA: DUF3500 domain-containing protein [Xanthobacteraceae bacterium]|nr:DUF3500 domain-containing protein [Xanthobacteraceae bacterium]